MMEHTAASIFCAASIALYASGVAAQEYPSKPVRIIAGGPGSTSDFAARLIAAGVSPFLGQPVVVENRGGAIQEETVFKSAPDGYTLLITGSSFWIAPLLRTMAFDPVADFSPITSVAVVPGVLAVHPSLPVNSVKELIALAKARPGELNVATGNQGSTSHLAAVLFKTMAGIDIVAVPYKSNAMQMGDLIGGQMHLSIDSASTAMPHVKVGKLKALGVGSSKPSSLAPGLPTIAASGVPGYEAGQTLAMYAPGKTPSVIIRRLNQDIVRALSNADVKQKFFGAGQEIETTSSEELAVKMRSEIARLGKVIRDAGIRID